MLPVDTDNENNDTGNSYDNGNPDLDTNDSDDRDDHTGNSNNDMGNGDNDIGNNHTGNVIMVLVIITMVFVMVWCYR